VDAHRREKESNVNAGLVPLKATTRRPENPNDSRTLTCNQKNRDISLIQALKNVLCYTHAREFEGVDQPGGRWGQVGRKV